MENHHGADSNRALLKSGREVLSWRGCPPAVRESVAERVIDLAQWEANKEAS